MHPDFTSLAPFGERNRDRVFVRIEADVDDMLLHDPSPMHEARRRFLQRNPRCPAYCETGRPYLRRTSGLAPRCPVACPRSGERGDACDATLRDSLLEAVQEVVDHADALE